jgi:CHC2 zinc finger
MASAWQVAPVKARRSVGLGGAVGSPINLARKGSERVGPCPKCGGTDRFSINTKKQVFNCRQCQTGGDVIKLVRFLDGCDPATPRRLKEAVLTIGVSRHERLGVIRRVRKTPSVAFAPPEWLPADALDENYFRLLPYGQSIVTTEEATMLAAVFGEDGELPARPLS